MPIQTQFPLQPMNREDFGHLSFDVMRDLFLIHNEMGRFFEETIYKRALDAVRSDVSLEVWIDVTHGSFSKRHYMDVVVQCGGVFEIKATDVLTPRHRSQLLHYLMLADLWHGMLVNRLPSSSRL